MKTPFYHFWHPGSGPVGGFFMGLAFLAAWALLASCTIIAKPSPRARIGLGWLLDAKTGKISQQGREAYNSLIPDWGKYRVPPVTKLDEGITISAVKRAPPALGYETVITMDAEHLDDFFMFVIWNDNPAERPVKK